MNDRVQMVEAWLSQSGDGRIATENASALAADSGIEAAMLSLVPIAASRARPTVSGFKVGAVGQGESGALYLGANFEFKESGLGQTVHAEQAVVANAAGHGETGLVRIAVSAPPCGHCRQFLYELATAKQLDVIIPGRSLAKLTDFLPGAFGPADLGLAGGLLDKTAGRGWLKPTSSADPLVQAVTAAARKSYAPYSRSWSSAAIQVSDGRIFTGAYLENAAFNPSLPPLQAAYVVAALAGCPDSAFERVMIAQGEDAKVDHYASAQSLIGKIAPRAGVELVKLSFEENLSGRCSMPREDGSHTFYFFDIDDNTLFLDTKVVLRNLSDDTEREIGTEELAKIRHLIGASGEWAAFEIFDGTYRNFRDLEDASDFSQQHFVRDIEHAIKDPKNTTWQAPSWSMLVHACQNRRPTVFITARGHSPETIRAGFKVLVDAGHLPAEPNYLAIYPVSNPKARQEILKAIPDDEERKQVEGMHDATSALKRFAIWQAVDMALAEFGKKPPHRFGMSDDDPGNIDLIVKAMCDCKKRYPDKRFFAIDTHKGQHVKLEVFPIDYAVTEELAPGEVVG